MPSEAEEENGRISEVARRTLRREQILGRRLMGPVTAARYLKHTPTYIKAELSKNKTIYIKMGSITSVVFDGVECSLTIHVGQRVYCLLSMDPDVATQIVSYSVKS